MYGRDCPVKRLSGVPSPLSPPSHHRPRCIQVQIFSTQLINLILYRGLSQGAFIIFTIHYTGCLHRNKGKAINLFHSLSAKKGI